MTRLRHVILLFAALFVGVAIAATQWSMQPRESTIGFEGTQAGAPFSGKFTRFKADIRFDPASLQDSRFDVVIDTASVDTGDAERDSLIKDEELFAVKRWPTARYVAQRFSARGTGKYSAIGQLTLRDVTREVPIEFSFEQTGGEAWLKGTAALKRLDFGVGQGDWRDTEAVANEVRIRFALRLARP